jgi:hypothetical protein
MQPFEVSYTTTGRSGKKARNVIGVLCPTVIAQRMGLSRPIFVTLGDVKVDWSAPQSEGYRAMFDTPNVQAEGAAHDLSRSSLRAPGSAAHVAEKG